MTDYLGYILVRSFSFVFCLLPLRGSLFIGRLIGRIVYLGGKKRRMIAYTNLKAAFAAEKSPSEIRAITKSVYKNLGMIFVEVLRFPVINKQYIKKHISLHGLEMLKVARSNNKGVIVLTAHFGNWELMSLIGGFLGYPVSVLAREQKHTKLNDLLNEYREMAGCRVIKKGIPTRNLFKALKANEFIGILSDQDAGRLGTFVDFFGRPTSSHNGTFAIAEKTGALVIPAFIVREGRTHHKIDVLNPVENIQDFSTVLESYARQYPEQWLWVHKRWKSTPLRKILVLNDRKPGHLNQSLAVAEIIQKYRIDKGYDARHTTYEVVDVKYKNDLSKLLLGACSRFSSSCCQGCLACLRRCLTRESYKALTAVYADIVISSGSSLAPVNVFMARELNAKNVVIMRPNLAPLKKFKLAIIPKHDSPRPRKNVLITTGAPNRISEELLRKEADSLSSRIKITKPLRLGLLIGGDNADYAMDVGAVKNIISRIKALSKKTDFEILATTSRRTPKDVETLLKEELGPLPNCRLLVIANEKNPQGTVPAILGSSNVVLVSGESISMISEAASSGRQVLVFNLKKKKGSGVLRHERMTAELSRAGLIKIIKEDAVAPAV
ncbi:MAG: ELM1/GtrOC1 family putative glycosyltransferase [Candidatus Omnitrophica bacterium]|nr:ELM1/GtrOC1 family putative glycosyltransferase [Candidatus Omnitrophota bacterium]